MRLFQNVGLSRSFRAHRPHNKFERFSAGIAEFFETRYGALHFLSPVMTGDPSAFLTTGDDEELQLAWAREHGFPTDSLENILRAQIEHHRTEVFYNLDPITYGSDFVRKLPGCVRKSICWRGVPSGNPDLTGYDLVVCNFPTILAHWRQSGCKTAYFSPAHDPVMDRYAASVRNLDLVFIGGFSRHHAKRSISLRAAASIPGIRARYHLEDSRLTRLANHFPFIPGLGTYRHPKEIRAVSVGPIYGRDLYQALAGAEIVLNGAVDTTGEDRGNMRCFEAAGCGALLLSDAGLYPDGFVDGETMVTYASPDQIPELIKRLLDDPARMHAIAGAGNAMVRARYSKQRQWERFQELL